MYIFARKIGLDMQTKNKIRWSICHWIWEYLNKLRISIVDKMKNSYDLRRSFVFGWLCFFPYQRTLQWNEGLLIQAESCWNLNKNTPTRTHNDTIEWKKKKDSKIYEESQSYANNDHHISSL